MPTHLCVITLRHHPRHPAQIEAHAVFRLRQIELFGHGVYIHSWAWNGQAVF